MTYTVTNWIDGSTPLNRANMMKIENELALLDQSAGGPLPPLSYGTTLPGSPVDGQEAILVDSTTASAYQWRFRWNAANASSYKWEFVGGAPYVGQDPASPSIPSGTWTLGPSLTMLRSGVYNVSCTSRIYQTPGDSSHRSYIGVVVAGTPQAQIDKGTLDAGPLTITWQVVATAGQLISHGSNADAGTTCIPSNRVIEVFPLRVS